MKRIFEKFLLVLVVLVVVGSGCSARDRNPYPYYPYNGGGGGNSAAVGIGVGAGLAALGLASGYGSYQQGETQRLAVVEGNKTQRKAIDAEVLLNGPCAVGGNGKVTYSSTEGEVDGKSTLEVKDTSGTPPCANHSVPPGSTPYYQTQVSAGSRQRPYGNCEELRKSSYLYNWCMSHF